jgi:hypothetical protein
MNRRHLHVAISQFARRFENGHAGTIAGRSISKDFDVPSNLDEVPEDYTPERDPVTMACNPGEAYFVIRDPEHPEKEMREPEAFAALRERWDRAQVRGPGRGWTPLAERKVP